MCDKTFLLKAATPPSSDQPICTASKKKPSTSISIDPNNLAEDLSPPSTEQQNCERWIKYLIFLNLIIILAASFILTYRVQIPKQNIQYMEMVTVKQIILAESYPDYENSVERPPLLDGITPVPTNSNSDYKIFSTFVRKLYNKVV